jgi:hypothetical protein
LLVLDVNSACALLIDLTWTFLFSERRQKRRRRQAGKPAHTDVDIMSIHTYICTYIHMYLSGDAFSLNFLLGLFLSILSSELTRIRETSFPVPSYLHIYKISPEFQFFNCDSNEHKLYVAFISTYFLYTKPL